LKTTERFIYFSLITLLITSIICATFVINNLSTQIKNERELNQTIKSYDMKVIAKKEGKIEELTDLVNSFNKELKLLYTFAKTGIKAETIEEVRELLALTANLPIGSPFKGDFIVTSPFGRRDESGWNGDNYHNGIDIIPTTGSARENVYLTADATIVEFGISETYGKYIIADTKHGYRVVYKHLSTIFYQDENGKVLDIPLLKGTKIARMGNTGSLSQGAHLHYEIQIWSDDLNEYMQLDPDEILHYIGD